MDTHSLYTRRPGSSASALANRTIRHRVLSLRVPEDLESESCLPVPGRAGGVVPSTSMEETDDAHLQPPIMVKETPRCVSPALPFAEYISSPLPDIRESSSRPENVLEAVPLTPQLKQYGLGATDGIVLGASQTPRYLSKELPPLPRSSRISYASIFEYFKGPDSESASRPKSVPVDSLASDRVPSYATRRYVTGLRDAKASSLKSLRSVRTRMPSIYRIKNNLRIPSLRLSDIVRPQQARTHSSFTSGSQWTSSSSARTCVTTVSVDSGHTYLVPGVSTTDRFTHKWPKPGNLKKLERMNTIRTTDEFPSVTSEKIGSGSFDVGLGFEHVGRWTTHKWCLLLSVLSVLGYSIAALVYTVLTWYQAWDHADVMLVADGDVLVLTTLCASLLLLSALVGLTGTLLNSRPLLAIYALLLWPAFVSLLSIGYISYKREVFSLDRKLNMAWSKWYTDTGRTVIQDSLRCCGFTDPTHEASYGPGFAGGCHPRSHRPGCKGPLLRFERFILGSLWRAAFSTVPLHIVNIIICLLCANHVTRTFGTGLLPRGYRLRLTDVRADAHRLLEHFASDRDGAARLPPPMARTETGASCWREDKVY